MWPSSKLRAVAMTFAEERKMEYQRMTADKIERFELGLEKPDPRRALHSVLTIAMAYMIGGIVPLIHYMFKPEATKAVIASVILTLVEHLIFSYAEGYFTGNKPLKCALQMAFIGTIASAAAFGMAKVVQA